jgi:hypothetical protein
MNAILREKNRARTPTSSRRKGAILRPSLAGSPTHSGDVHDKAGLLRFPREELKTIFETSPSKICRK